MTNAVSANDTLCVRHQCGPTTAGSFKCGSWSVEEEAGVQVDILRLLLQIKIMESVRAISQRMSF